MAYTDGRFLIHHLGQCVFAVVARREEIFSVEKFSAGLVHFLKKDGFYKVHIGSSNSELPAASEKEGATTGRRLLDSAWTALQTAGRRGPFSFCDYRLLVDAKDHPLHKLASQLQRSLQRLFRTTDRFCLAEVGGKSAAGAVAHFQRATEHIEGGAVLPAEDGVHLFFPGYAPEKGVKAAREVLARVRHFPELAEMHAGVSCFPCQDFSRAETIANARKALLHANFFEAGEVVLFDAVSLNVAGDIYFGEGDLPSAVREYRRGLVLEPDNVNLLNSLGVTYALLNKTTPARRCFERVLQIDGEDHMALYNLGLGAQLRGDIREALDRFEAAIRSCDDSEDNAEVKRDLQLQLGRLHCRKGQYREALTYLEEWRVGVSERRQGGIFRYLGEAHRGLGQGREAMTWLHRALQHNGNDHEALSLLGITILEEREGNDIALSLCRKSVELAPDNPILRLRLAEVQLSIGNPGEALESLKRCRGGRVDRRRVQLLKAQVYTEIKQLGKARYWAKKVMADAEDTALSRRARALLDFMEQ